MSLTSAVRQGGRIASTNAGAGPGGVNEDGDCLAPCSPANAPMLAQLAANAVQQAGMAMPRDSINELWVYKANAQGYSAGTTVAAGDVSWACTTNCVRYRWVPAKDQFRYYGGTWTSSTINACANSTPPADAVGIYLLATHDFLSGIFTQDIRIDDHAVFVFEPLPTLLCGAGTHP